MRSFAPSRCAANALASRNVQPDRSLRRDTDQIHTMSMVEPDPEQDNPFQEPSIEISRTECEAARGPSHTHTQEYKIVLFSSSKI